MTKIGLLALTLLLAACAGVTPGSSISPTTSARAPGPADPASLVGREFLSVSVVRGGAVVPLAAGTHISIAFTADQIGIRAGCNIMGGSYGIEGGVLVTNAMSMTEMACQPPRDAQDAWVARFIGARPTIVLDGNNLSLAVGDTIISLLDREIAIPDLALAGPTWMIDSVISGDVVSSFPATVVASLIFAADGSVAIRTGCNSGGGRYILGPAKGSIAISDIVLTKRACVGGAGQLEAEMLSILRAPALTYALDAQTLRLMAGPMGLGLTGR